MMPGLVPSGCSRAESLSSFFQLWDVGIPCLVATSLQTLFPVATTLLSLWPYFYCLQLIKGPYDYIGIIKIISSLPDPCFNHVCKVLTFTMWGDTYSQGPGIRAWIFYTNVILINTMNNHSAFHATFSLNIWKLGLFSKKREVSLSLSLFQNLTLLNLYHNYISK